ncbi:MAG: putative repeat protein (TIGR01451 family) [Celeribacter sp.]|jgi:uncharacterized repeat protein (TIGR01451 family)
MAYSISKHLSPLVLGVAFFAYAPAVADTLGSTLSFLVVETDTEGKEALVERASVKPGEVIHYILSHENTAQEDMQGLIVAAPVPEGVTLTSGGQSSSVPSIFEVQAELDPDLEGLEWSTLPAMRKVVSSDGTLREEVLPETEIKAVRWSFLDVLEVGETAENTFRVRVN